MKLLKILIIILLLSLLTGCYDKRELDDLAYVICIGADKGEKEELRITFQLAIPTKIGGENAEPGKDSTTVISVESPSLFTAMSLANSTVSKELNIAHTKLIVYSEELAKEDLSGYLNAFITNKDLRPRTSVVVCKGTAKEFIESVAPVLEINPARYYDLLLSSYNYTGYNSGNELIDFYTAINSPMAEPTALFAEIDYEDEENPNPKFNGIAAFQGTKMVRRN